MSETQQAPKLKQKTQNRKITKHVKRQKNECGSAAGALGSLRSAG